MKQRIFVDMDGVLCEYRTDVAVADMIKDGYFRALRPRKKMISAIKSIVNSGEYEVYVISSIIPENAEISLRDKNYWLDTYLPQIDYFHRIFPLCGTNKADCVVNLQKNDILCDDYSENLKRWESSGGSAVKILNEVNGKGFSFKGTRVDVKKASDLITAFDRLTIGKIAG